MGDESIDCDQYLSVTSSIFLFGDDHTPDQLAPSVCARSSVGIALGLCLLAQRRAGRVALVGGALGIAHLPQGR